MEQSLRILRENLGLTQKQLADKLNLTSQAIANYENGKRMPSLNLAVKYAKELNISLEIFAEILLNDEIIS